MARPRKIIIILVIGAIVVISAILIRQPWQKKTMVLSAKVPDSQYVVELWERPYCYFGFGNEYETWLVVKSPQEEAHWYLIDDKYVTFRKVLVFASSDYTKIRIETDGETTPSHMIAEYDLWQKKFRAESEKTVKNEAGWTILKEQLVR